MSEAISISKNGTIYALIFPKSLKAPEGVRFLTKEEMPMQVGLMERPKGYLVKPHMHPKTDRHITTTPEFLYIESGKILAKVFDEQWVLIGERELGAGDFLLFLAGGHAVEILDDARFIEVKQGPFAGPTKDKISPPVL